MHKASVSHIIEAIKQGETFDYLAEDGSFTLKIDDYVPFVCAAVHDGHQFRESLLGYCLHSDYERWYEEDPHTKQMVSSHPIVIAGCDSRFEYDLNRPPETAIYEDAWGKKLWKSPLPESERSLSLEKHTAFYQVVGALMKKLEQLYPQVLVFDMHSYNWKRWERMVPVWNIGTANIDQARFGKTAEQWRSFLEGMELPESIMVDAKINDTFQGNGYFLKYITKNHPNSLVLATEIAKVYCDELDGSVYQNVVCAVELALKRLIPLQVEEFING
ncbi:N-formylglutamate amidohydrolase [Sediminicola luteus]|uniref:N-formylglutamate amidohydrolase n=1 Tax=Sediminicola luteus TaxID=319238 RepID=A0A2A4G786_9FLAO|nr:N-formylglutamate amidohydrolase [Sediminicola luteus]PCE63814.1 hypothetical protein B7P33_11125 [Sediminicola luteus]